MVCDRVDEVVRTLGEMAHEGPPDRERYETIRDQFNATRIGLLDTSGHERGIGVVAYHLGVPFASVDIYRTDAQLGLAQFTEIPIDEDGRRSEAEEKLRIENFCIASFAGGLAGAAAMRRRSERYRGSEGDHRSVEELLSRTIVGATDPMVFRHYRQYLWHRARVLVSMKKVWADISAVAEALLERRKLSAEE